MQGYLYIGTKSHRGAEIWRYDEKGKAGWTNVTPAWAGPNKPYAGGPGRNEAMVIFKDRLYLAEGFPTANLAKFDGTNWSTVVNGPHPFYPLNGGLLCLAVLKNHIYV
jgi:hypothetical protein